MKCPVCNVTLLLAEKHGIEIDYCPQCRGIWLDRGELEKIIDKSSQQEPPQYAGNRYGRNHDDHDYSDDHRYKRKKGFLGDLFDF
jgi:uncharacterized protein